jgi:hypothetical protein
VVLQWRYSDVTLLLHWCYSGFTVVLHCFYSGVKVTLQWCCSGVTVVLQCCYLVRLTADQERDVVCVRHHACGEGRVTV